MVSQQYFDFLGLVKGCYKGILKYIICTVKSVTYKPNDDFN